MATEIKEKTIHNEQKPIHRVVKNKEMEPTGISKYSHVKFVDVNRKVGNKIVTTQRIHRTWDNKQAEADRLMKGKQMPPRMAAVIKDTVKEIVESMLGEDKSKAEEVTEKVVTKLKENEKK